MWVMKVKYQQVGVGKEKNLSHVRRQNKKVSSSVAETEEGRGSLNFCSLFFKLLSTLSNDSLRFPSVLSSTRSSSPSV